MTSPVRTGLPASPAALNAAHPAFLRCCSPHSVFFPCTGFLEGRKPTSLVSVPPRCSAPSSYPQHACGSAETCHSLCTALQWLPGAHRAAGDLSASQISRAAGVPATTAGCGPRGTSSPSGFQSASHACWWPEMARNFLSSLPAPQSSASLAVPSFHHFHQPKFLDLGHTGAS